MNEPIAHFKIPLLEIAVVLAATFVLGTGVGRATAPKEERCDMTKVVSAVEGLDGKVTQMAAARCMVITTPVLNITSYTTPNLGVVKMPPPAKPKG